MSVASCGGGGDDGGIIGTGIQLKGTVPTERAFARSEVEVRSADGQRSTAAIAANGRYVLSDVAGEGPYLLRVDLGNTDAYYGIAFAAGATDITQNIHAYSDLAIRNWFATRGADIDAAFASAGALSPLPSATEIAAIDSRIQSLISASLSAYELGDVNLGNVSFDANDSGVDRFLDGNPVLINNGTITIIVTSPDTATQAEVTNALPIGTDLTAADTTAPGAPAGLRVLPSATDEIVVAWEASMDDIGVANYEVRRDGAVVGTTPYPVFIDSPLQPNITYTYTVVALDASANRSQESAPGSAQTLAAPDVTAPPAPSSVQLIPGRNSIRVQWQQSDIADVAAFTLRRGRTATMLEQRARVTSTFALDAGLNSGTEYCYQVAATDGSENDSAFTSVACATTQGNAVTTAAPVPVPGPAPTETTPSNLAGIDVSNLACTVEVQEFIIETATTFSGSCLRVPRDISVSDGGQLTIAAGTVLKFAANAGIIVRTGGSLTAAGTAAAPIVLSGVENTAGFWDGIDISFSNSNRNRFENVLIEHAGTTSSAALRTNTTTSNAARLAASNVLLRNSAGAGFLFEANTVLDAFADVVSTGNARSGELSLNLVSGFGSGNRFAGNAEDGLTLLQEIFEAPVSFVRTDVPYLADTLTLRAALSIPAGVEIRFASGASLNVQSEGSLNAVGTAADPIVLTGSEPSPGHWNGVNYAFSASTNNLLQHVVIEYAGAGRAQGDAGGLTTNTTRTAPVRLALQDVVLRSNTGGGFRFEANTILSSFDRVSSSGNDVPGSMYPSTLNGVGTGNTFVGNMRDQIDLQDESIDVAVTVPALDVPFTFDRFQSQFPITISPGVTMLARAGGVIDITSRGSLTAVGTADSPIRIVGAVGQPGYWAGIRMVFNGSAANQLDFVTLAHGGGAGIPGETGNIQMQCNRLTGSRFSIANSTLSDSAGWAVYRDESPICVIDLGPNVTFISNAQGDLSPVPQ